MPEPKISDEKINELDDELIALDTIVTALGGLDATTQARVLRYLVDRFGSSGVAVKP